MLCDIGKSTDLVVADGFTARQLAKGLLFPLWSSTRPCNDRLDQVF